MAVRHYVLLATDGFIDLPNEPNTCTTDRTKIYAWGFIGGLFEVDGKKVKGNEYLDWKDEKNWETLMNLKGTATIPSPIVWADVGDRIYITLINLGMKYRPDLPDFHTIHMHGAHVATQLDGFPETSFGVPMWMEKDESGKLEKPPAATYYFNPQHPGTLMYHCHIEASEHVQMGMYGALIIYPSTESLAKAGIKQHKDGRWFVGKKWIPYIPKTATHRNFAYNNIHTYFDKENIMLLSDIDSVWHKSVLEDTDFNAVNFKPDYWLVNGRAFPDTLLPHPLTPGNESDPNLTQINYESYVHVKTDDRFLLRMINLGYQVVPWHIHGWHFIQAGKDAHLSPFLAQQSRSIKLDRELVEQGFTATIGSGETFDLLLTADNKAPQYRNYIVNGQDGFPSLCKQMREIQKIDSEAIFDIPTEPVNCPDPNTVNYVDICNCQCGGNDDKFFPQFYPMHNHDDYKVTNNGVYPGGQLTYIQTDAPESCDGHKEDYLTETEDIIDEIDSKENITEVNENMPIRNNEDPVKIVYDEEVDSIDETMIRIIEKDIRDCIGDI
ncbi:multicopper oxidase domain-containing protein [Anaeromicrobium sediminis]|uniref:Copper oxidase n=1 Tax=Anaeromicrobium sediminis TaxID=1478221 RepID=A0A267MH03_9FIRM|nr:multicopper oxidase domain-containing protein [Anaeromicrobium sediminis]PAB58682.1 copper oxidase [Anaeromicrobium sediminis]